MARKPTIYRNLLLAGLVGVALLVGIVLVLREQPAVSPAASGRTARPEATSPTKTGGLPVQVLKPHRQDLTRTLTLPANVSPWYQATLYAKVPGYLKWMGVDKGDRVEKGQLLAEINAPEVEQQYRKAEADYKIKQVTFERLHNVWKEDPDVIAKQAVDVAQAEAEGARHNRDDRRTMLGYTKVVAPFSGVITARFADPGALIQAATGSASQAAPLFTIMDIDMVRVYVGVPQETALLAVPGVPTFLTARELPGKEFRGSITRTSQSLDPTTRSLLVEIDLPNKDQQLLPGMFVNATLILAEHKQVLALPPAALVTEGAEKSVFIAEQGTARQVPVGTGLDDGVWVEITKGLADEMAVVVVGKTGLRDGQRIQASPYKLPAGKPASQKY
jgi:membrane fusion protein, multidrug efflux system